MFLVIGMLLTFIAHAVMGAFKLFGTNADALKPAAWICFCFIFAHVIVTSVLTYQSLYARKKSGAGYFKENKLFWARRISGFAILIPLIMHLMIFKGTERNGSFRLVEFSPVLLVSQLLLVLTIAFHVITNIEPAMTAFGIKRPKLWSHDTIFVISVILLLAACAFAFYYLRWIAS